PLHPTQRILTAVGLARFFPADAIIGGDGPFARKPQPDGLRHLMAAANAAPARTLLVGAPLIDWRTARAASTAGCLVRYGFGFEGVPLDDLRADDRIVDAPRDLLQIAGVE